MKLLLDRFNFQIMHSLMSRHSSHFFSRRDFLWILKLLCFDLIDCFACFGRRVSLLNLLGPSANCLPSPFPHPPPPSPQLTTHLLISQRFLRVCPERKCCPSKTLPSRENGSQARQYIPDVKIQISGKAGCPMSCFQEGSTQMCARSLVLTKFLPPLACSHFCKNSLPGW